MYSPDDFIVNVIHREQGDTKGFLLTIDNIRLTTISQYRVRVLKAQSYDTRHKDWRENNLNAFAVTDTNPIRPSYTGQGIWLLRKIESSKQLQVGNETGHPLEWPENDKSPIQAWLLTIDIIAQEVAKPNANAKQLAAINQKLIVNWNKANDDLSINVTDSH